jgi:hypothetical protein
MLPKQPKPLVFAAIDSEEEGSRPILNDRGRPSRERAN